MVPNNMTSKVTVRLGGHVTPILELRKAPATKRDALTDRPSYVHSHK